MDEGREEAMGEGRQPLTDAARQATRLPSDQALGEAPALWLGPWERISFVQLPMASA